MASMSVKSDDDERLDEAIEETSTLVRLDLPSDSTEWFMLARIKLDAIKTLVPLLERRAKMHGYDSAAGQGEDEGSIAAVKRRLEAVK